MQSPFSNLPPSELENRYPDSLYLELAAAPVSLTGSNIEQIDLYLTINFHEQWQSINTSNTGRVKFGFKGGELQLWLENGKIPPEYRQLKGKVQLSPENNTALQSIECDVVAQGGEQSPTWRWQGKTGASVLWGSLQQEKLATVQVTGQPCLIKAVFTVSPWDVYLTGAEGFWLHDISPNQLAVLERKLVLFLLKSQLQPYLSRVVWQYEDQQGLQNINQQNSDCSETHDCSELEAAIEGVIAAKTDNFLELAKLAGLDPIVDFAGAKLLGVNLSGVDLSGANLHRAYLRGSDLSDADLSSADLSMANLGGADLSGAYLSNANLIGADLHRASLALANLSGANLSGANLSDGNLISANLSDVNLSNANFTGADLHRASLILANLSGAVLLNAKIEEARFGKNLEFSEQEKLNLQQRGAFFED